MKVLEINNGKCYFFRNEEKNPITEIEKKDILNFLEKIYSDEDIDYDSAEDIIVHNDAEKIIYSAIIAKLEDFKIQKTNLKREIDEEFSEIEKKYNQ